MQSTFDKRQPMDWERGTPRPVHGDVRETRARWEPHIDAWCVEMKNNFEAMYQGSPYYRGQLGWCNNPKLWTVFWHELCKQPVDRMQEGFKRYVGWAAAGNSLAFFATAPDTVVPMMDAVLLDCVGKPLMHPNVVALHQQRCQQLSGSRLDGSALWRQQKSAWAHLCWEESQLQFLTVGRSGANLLVEDIPGVLAAAIAQYQLDAAEQRKVLGHVFMGDSAWVSSAHLMQAIVREVGPVLAPDANLGLVALCSGYPYHGVEGDILALHDVHRLALGISAPRHKECLHNAAMAKPLGVVGTMLQSLYGTFTCPQALYEAVVELGVFCAPTADFPKMDSNVFSL